MLAFAPATGVNAQQLSIKASADSMQLLMGSKATLHVEVIKPAGPGVLAGAPWQRTHSARLHIHLSGI